MSCYLVEKGLKIGPLLCLADNGEPYRVYKESGSWVHAKGP